MKFSLQLKSYFFRLKFCAVFILFFSSTVFSQEQLFIRGKILDGKDSTGLPSVQILLINQKDTIDLKNTQTDEEGKFYIGELSKGNYKFKAIFLGYKTLVKDVEITDKPVFLRKLTLTPDAQILKQVDVEAVQIRQEQKGDTTLYNADAFKVNKDATTEDLVKKMPGITIENGTVKHQGEDVKKVLIDGKEFFGDDANIALKNIPAEMVDKVQVYDRASDQGFFSGFDDGNSQKTMNIMTKNNKNNGTFGKAYAGYGIEDDQTGRYQAGANYNMFKGARRVSIVAMSNNINMQNFGSQDLLGLSGSQGGQRGGMGGGMGGMGRGGGGGGNWGGMGGNGNAMNFVVGQQGGISTTHSIGTNYSDVWGKNTLVTASYFYNQTDNDASSGLNRVFFTQMGAGQNYNEDKSALSNNGNHRFNLRFEHFIDSMNSIVFNPRISFQDNQSNNLTNGVTNFLDTVLSSLESKYNSNNAGYNSNNTLLYRKRFKKYGRTFSAQLGADLNSKTGNADNYSLNKYFSETDSLQKIDQLSDNTNGGQTYSGSISYTEPIGNLFGIQLTYNPSINYNFANKKTYNLDSISGIHSRTDTLLSNEYNNTITTQKGGISLRYKTEKMLLGAGVNYQEVVLNGKQDFPFENKVNKPFNNFLPMVTFQYRFSKTSNLRMNYRTMTILPTVNQLQDVVDNSNTLMLSSGNSDLKQNFNHFLMTRYNYTNPVNSRSFFFFIMGNWVEDYIGNSTFLARKDTLLDGGILLRQGSQLSKPINISGNRTFRCYTTFSSPIKKIKSTANLNLGFSYNDLPGLINGRKNIASTTTYNAGLVMASNISEKLDFTITWNGYYNLVTNTLQTNSNNNYYYHITTTKLNWNFFKSFHLASEINYTYYEGLNNSFNQEFTLWNNSIAYKFLKNNSGEIKLGVYDALRQNNSVGRNVTETFFEDTQTRVLQRYYMLTFTWTYRKFVKKEEDKKKKENRK
ncbi:MAG: outer membrane beta-barrel protein [Bacteroidota bacterium]|jgi:hypothetical protein